jgi:predicted flap endonuclease-1-like 5' DNA nuclease
MTYLLLQTFLLLLASYFLGAFVACMVKRAFFGSRAEAPAHVLAPARAEVSHTPPIVVPPQPVRVRPTPPVLQPVTPRAIDPVQPKIEVLRRPEPRPAPTVLDPSRFERALMGPDFNEGIPRIAIVEVRPSVLKPVTDVYRPRPPEPAPAPVVEEPPPEVPVVEDVVEPPPIEVEAEPELTPKPEPEPRTGGLAARLRDATTAAAAGAVAAAKAAAAASVMMPGMGLSRRASIEEKVEEKRSGQAQETVAAPAAAEENADTVSDDAPEHSENFDELVVEPPALSSDEDAPVEENTFVEESAGQTEFEPEPELVQEPELETEPTPEPEPVAKPERSPVAEPEPEPAAPVPIVPAAIIEGGDDFQRIRAIDSGIEQKLKASGVNYFEHIAAWSASDIKRIGQELESPGRIDREQWVEQAQILAKGGETYYSRNRKAMLKTNAAPVAPATPKPAQGSTESSGAAVSASGVGETPSQSDSGTSLQREGLSGVAAASQGRSVAEMAAAAAAAIAAASSSVTRGLKPIEPISPLSKVNPKISMPARITDAIREKGASTATVEITKGNTSPAPEVPSEGPHDDLKRIRGIGVLIEKRLNAMGIRLYEQIANWTSGDIDRVSRMLEFKGRIERESWVEQARILDSGGYTEFSRRVDRGEVDTSRET